MDFYPAKFIVSPCEFTGNLTFHHGISTTSTVDFLLLYFYNAHCYSDVIMKIGLLIHKHSSSSLFFLHHVQNNFM